MKKILIAIASIIVILGIAVALYILFFGTPGAKLTVNSGGAFTTSTTLATQSTGQIGGAGNAGTVVAPGLVQITNLPVAAGVSVTDIEPATTTLTTTASSSVSTTTITTSTGTGSTDVVVHYIDRESGNVYSYGALTRTLTRISNKTLPGVQLASWLSDGTLAFVQFIAQADGGSHVDTYALPATGGTGYFLQEDLEEAIATPHGTIFTLAAGTDSSIGSVANSDGTNVKTVFSSPLTALTVQPAGNTFIATTKATSELPGYAFAVNGSGDFTPLLGPLKGLTTLPSPSGNQVLYSYTDGTKFHMSVLDLSTGSVTALPLATITDKCVWAIDGGSIYCGIPSDLSGNLPDSWYQGTVSFTDKIWKIDLGSRLATLVLDPSQASKTTIDAVNLEIDPNARVLIFRNKKDSSLWAYSL